MNKQDWLAEAINYIDALNDEEFDDFIVSCVPYYSLVKISYSEIKLGKCITIDKAANMTTYCTDNISLAA